MSQRFERPPTASVGEVARPPLERVQSRGASPDRGPRVEVAQVASLELLRCHPPRLKTTWRVPKRSQSSVTSPSGPRVYADLFAMNADGSGIRQVTTSTFWDFRPEWEMHQLTM